MTGHEDDLPATGQKLEQPCVNFQTELCFLVTTQFSIHHQSKVCAVSGAWLTDLTYSDISLDHLIDDKVKQVIQTHWWHSVVNIMPPNMFFYAMDSDSWAG